MKLNAFSIQIICLILTWNSFYASYGQTIRYVKPVAEGAGNGTSWENASSNLQTIIDASDINDEIWVAAGTYKPSSYPTGANCIGCVNAKDYAFILKNGTKLYGGFLGNETDFALRNPKLNSTQLSGDLNGDGSLRTYHIVISVADQNTTVIDGFTIFGGGGGKDVETTSTIESTVVGRTDGGGMVVINSSPIIRNCIFTNNVNTNRGGGIYIFNNAQPTLNNCTFKANSSNEGAAGYINSATPVFNQCVIVENNATSLGGAFSIWNCSPTFSSSVLSKNTADGGGAIFVSAFSTSGRKDCYPKFENCIFSQNAATNEGGVAYGSAGSMYPNSAFSGINGKNCLFVGNTARRGSVITNALNVRTAAGVSSIMNSIVWGNNGNYPFADRQTNGINCVSQPGDLSGSENLFADPLFVNPNDPDGPDNIWGTADDGLQLAFCSPAIDFASFYQPLSFDILGNPIYNSIKDAGPYERQSASCQVYAGLPDCQSVSVENVKESRWYRFFTNDGLIAEINPNGLDLGTVTMQISDNDGIINFNDNKFLGRTINVTCSKYASGVAMPETYKIRFYYSDTELAEYNSATSGVYTPASFNMAWKNEGTGCTLDSYAETNSGMVAKTDITSGEYGTSDNGFYLQYALNHLTIFAPTTAGSNTLPVTLASFTGRNEGLHNVLRWQTTSETNNDRFEIERSQNGINFQIIGEYISGAGTTSESNSYTFNDGNYNAGVNYYRLKQVDTDGTFVFSRILAIKNDAIVALYPNPVRNEVFLDTQEKKFNYEIINIAGRVVKKGISKSKTGISTSDLPTGVYFISYEDQIFRFVKE